MSDGQSRSSSWSPESEKNLGNQAGEQLIVHYWQHRAPQGRHLEEEVHVGEGPVCTAVALRDAGWWSSAGGPCEADTVLSSSVLWDVQWVCREQADIKIHTGQIVQTPSEVQHAVTILTCSVFMLPITIQQANCNNKPKIVCCHVTGVQCEPGSVCIKLQNSRRFNFAFTLTFKNERHKDTC